MEKFKDFLNRWFDDLFFSQLISFVILTAVSIGVQLFLFWFGNITTTGYVGLLGDIILFALIIAVAPRLLNSSDLFPFKETAKIGKLYYFIIWLAIIGIYIYTIKPDLGWVFLAICIAVLLWFCIMLEHVQADDGFYIPVGFALVWCLGTGVATQFSRSLPAINEAELIALIVITTAAWMRPAFD